MILTKILNILEIDFEDFSSNVVPLNKREILKLYKEFYKDKQYKFEGKFTKGKEVYTFSINEVVEGSLITFNSQENLNIKLSRNDIFRLLKGYEASRYIDNEEFIFYIKDSGISTVQKILEQYDVVRTSFLNEVIDITKANIREFFYLLEIGEYSYIGEINGDRESILIDDNKEYDERIILIKKFNL